MKSQPTPIFAALLAVLLVASAVSVEAASNYEYQALARDLRVTAPASGESSSSTPSSPSTTPPSNPAVLGLSTNVLNFGSVATNFTSTRQVLVYNSGGSGLTFTAAPAVSGDTAFGAGATTCGTTLEAGSDCLADVTFYPVLEGAVEGLLSVSTSATGSPHTVTLQGVGYNPVSLVETSLPSGSVGANYSFDFKQLLAVSNESTPDKALASWQGTGTLPAGLSFDTSTGVLSGVPAQTTTGAGYTVLATYKNNKGQRLYTIVVNGVVLEVSRVTAGAYHSCAITAAGALKCWGENTYGQVGDGTTVMKTKPADVVGLQSGVVEVVAGINHTCALTSSGGAKCWGQNTYSQLGDNGSSNQLTPANVYGFTSGVKTLGAGDYHTCAVTTAGSAKCWGRNAYGNLGDGTASSRSIPTQVTGLDSGVKAIEPGLNHTCAVLLSGGVKCWGENGNGQLGDGTIVRRYFPVDVYGLTYGVSGVTTGSAHSCALLDSGAVKCWGLNSSGQLGDSSTATRLTPTQVSGLDSGVKILASGANHNCVVTFAGGVKCWGQNNFNQLGDGTTANSSAPVNVSGLASGVTGIAAGTSHTCVVTQANEQKCWGRNSLGQLGDGTTTQRSTPVSVLLP